MDSKLGVPNAPTRRMMHRDEQARNPPQPKVPDFLQRCPKSGKRSKGSKGSSKTLFIPDWGIYTQDSVLGSPSLALDWSKCSITPPDLITTTTGDRLQDSEAFGTQAFYQVNLYLKFVSHSRGSFVTTYSYKSFFFRQILSSSLFAFRIVL